MRFFYGDPVYGRLEHMMTTVPGFENEDYKAPRRRNDISSASYLAGEGTANMIRRFTSYQNCDDALEASKVINRKRLFIDEKHRKRFTLWYEKYHKNNNTSSRQNMAAVFLLSADDYLWSVFEPLVYEKKICFKDAKLKEINKDQYILYKMAKQIYTGENLIDEKKLAKPNAVSKEIFIIYVNANLIRAYGEKVLQMESEERNGKDNIQGN